MFSWFSWFVLIYYIWVVDLQIFSINQTLNSLTDISCKLSHDFTVSEKLYTAAKRLETSKYADISSDTLSNTLKVVSQTNNYVSTQI